MPPLQVDADALSAPTKPSCLLRGNDDSTASVDIVNVTFVDNTAAVADGGALFLKPHETCRSDDNIIVNILASRFIRNRVLGAGGAIAVSDASAATLQIRIVDSVFDSNSAGTVTGKFTSSVNFGGALLVWREPADINLNLTSSCFLEVENTSFESNRCDGGSGGAVMLMSCSSRFTKCNFTGNQAFLSGGAVGALQVARSTPTLGLAAASSRDSLTAANAPAPGFGQSASPLRRRMLSLAKNSDMNLLEADGTHRMGGSGEVEDAGEVDHRRKLVDTEICSGSYQTANWVVSLTDCKLEGNSAHLEYGGALYLYAATAAGQIHVAGCTFKVRTGQYPREYMCMILTGRC